MRFIWLFAALAMPAFSAPTAKYDNVWHGYEAELAKQCGSKHLEWLAPAELRDALDDYKQPVPRAIARQMSRSEMRACQNSIAGATCFNVGDIKVAEQSHLLEPLTAKVCSEYAKCREQSDCDRSGT